MPTPITNYTIVTLHFSDGYRLCAFGGRDSAGRPITTVQCYSPELNNVVTKANLPADFTDYLPGGVAAVNNKAYIFGAFRGSSTPYNLDVTYEYDPATNDYTARGNMALARGYIITAVVDGKIYAFGGETFDGTDLSADIKAERYDPATNLWSDVAVPDLPVASGEGRAFGFDHNSGYEFSGQIILAGGGMWPEQTAEVLSYDLDSQTYDYDFPDLNVARRDHAAFFQPGNTPRMWVLGGGLDKPPHGPTEYYSVKVNTRIFLPLVLRNSSH